jgi:endo-1,4-beta-xylanase
MPRPLDDELSRRSFLRFAALGVAAGAIACTGDGSAPTASSTTSLEPIECAGFPAEAETAAPLWQVGMERGIVFGSSAATWQLADPAYRRVFSREAALLFTEDDLLWYRLRPDPDASLDFTFGDEIVGYAEREGMLVLGAHLAWDEGFGEGWTRRDLIAMGAATAERLLYGTIEEVVGHYRGRVGAWIVANEVVDGIGIRTDVPWYRTIGPPYIAQAFEVAAAADPDATLLLNDFGLETDDDFAAAADKRTSILTLLDELLDAGVPVHAVGVQAHLAADGFAERFDADAYLAFLAEVAARGLGIMITELDVLDDGLPADVGPRDRAVADTITAYLDVALLEPAVSTVSTFGLTDRYTWLEEDFPRDDGAPRRPLPYDEDLEPKPAYRAVRAGLAGAPVRAPAWEPPRC